jgi:UPF0755 protein
MLEHDEQAAPAAGRDRSSGEGAGTDGDPPSRPPRDRKIGRIILPVLVAVLVLAAFGLSRFYSWATGASGPRTPVVLEIPAGSSGSEIATLLQSHHVIRSSLGFRILARVKHSGDFQAGRYELTTNMTASEALDVLEQPPSKPILRQVRLTIPEGFNVVQEAARVASVTDLSAQAYRAAATGGGFTLAGYLPAGTKSLEGFLFPDTYFVYPDAAAKDVIDEQLNRFGVVAGQIHLTDRAKALGVTPEQVVIVASIIEREAKFAADRPRVAEVVYNRLKAGMKLQLDSTVAYAAGKVGQTLSHADYRSRSPYNTYTHVGLPVGPISNPGKAALEAALAPSHAGYLYFILIDKAGHEAFTASYAEFLRLKHRAP